MVGGFPRQWNIFLIVIAWILIVRCDATGMAINSTKHQYDFVPGLLSTCTIYSSLIMRKFAGTATTLKLPLPNRTLVKSCPEKERRARLLIDLVLDMQGGAGVVRGVKMVVNYHLMTVLVNDEADTFSINGRRLDQSECQQPLSSYVSLVNLGSSVLMQTEMGIMVRLGLDRKIEIVINGVSPTDLCGLCGQQTTVAQSCNVSVPQSTIMMPKYSPIIKTGRTRLKPNIIGISYYTYDANSDKGPQNWHKVKPDWMTCDSTRTKSQQSPIDISWSGLSELMNTTVLQYRVDHGKADGVLANNGHAPTFTFTKRGPSATLTGVPETGDTYDLVQLHFHFGNQGTEGSEHSIKGHLYDGEVHLVHRNSRYPSMGEAVKYRDGLAVVGIMLEESLTTPTDSDLLKLINLLPNITHEGDLINTTVDVLNLVPSLSDLSSFFTYEGSLTTPGCMEVVRWLVLQNPLLVSKKHMALLRSLHTGNEGSEFIALKGNSRPLQPLNNRRVFASPAAIVRLRAENGKHAHHNESNVFQSAVPKLPPAAHVNTSGTEVAQQLPKPDWIYMLPNFVPIAFSYAQWSMNGPDKWHQISLDWVRCEGDSTSVTQSPIDLETSDIHFSPVLSPLLYKYSTTPPEGTLVNDGTGIVYKYTTQYAQLSGVPYIKGDTFILDHIRIRYGPNDLLGSEHTVNGRHFPGEVQLLHYNSKYSGLSEAIHYHDGVAAISIFLQISNYATSPALSKMVQMAKHIGYPGNAARISIDSRTLISSLQTYVFYHGSLTFPPCSESVFWIILSNPMSITENELMILRTVIADARMMIPVGMYGNARPTQSKGTNSRVEANFIPTPFTF